jgi:trans-aconitate methyltransferase
MQSLYKINIIQNQNTITLIYAANSNNMKVEAHMTQTWDPRAYQQNAAFVHESAGEVLEWLAAQEGERILDLGCGDGQLTCRIAATGASVIGVDASAEMVAAARSRGIVADEAAADLLPYADGGFDAVFSNAALHWVRNQDAMMDEVRRVLRPGGSFVAEMGGSRQYRGHSRGADGRSCPAWVWRS